MQSFGQRLQRHPGHRRRLALTAPAAGAPRSVLLVLAGVNGAGKSSIGGDDMLRRASMVAAHITRGMA